MIKRLLPSRLTLFRVPLASRRHITSHTCMEVHKMDDKIVPEGYVKIIEGEVSMLYKQNESVFYNKVQVLNRDISIQMITLFSEIRINEKNKKLWKKYPDLPGCDGIHVLDALAATGLRSIR